MVKALDRRAARQRLRELDGADRGRFAERFLSPSQIAALPPIEPLVDDVLDRGTLACL